MTIAAGEDIIAADIQSIKDDVDKLTDAANDEVLTGETTSSTSYTDLATSGPAVTITTGTFAMVVVTADMQNDTGGQISHASFEVSGATSAPATDNRALIFESSAADDRLRASIVQFVSLTAGSNTFTAKYRVTGGTGTFRRRRIEVLPIGA